MGVELLAFNVLLYTKSEQKGICNSFCIREIFNNPLKNRFFNQKYTFTFCDWRLWNVIRYFLIEKQAFKGLLKVIGLQKELWIRNPAFSICIF